MGVSIEIVGEKLDVRDAVYPKLDISSYWKEFSDKSFHCLKYIDFYGNTIFNQLQLKDLLDDCEKIQKNLKNKDVLSYIKDVIRMTKKAQKMGPHIYIKFKGD